MHKKTPKQTLSKIECKDAALKKMTGIKIGLGEGNDYWSCFFFFFFAIQFKGFGQTTETQTVGSIKERHVAGCHKEPPALFIKIKTAHCSSSAEI